MADSIFQYTKDEKEKQGRCDKLGLWAVIPIGIPSFFFPYFSVCGIIA